jgi:glycosyltransferase involved in cell wall biosynthesis
VLKSFHQRLSAVLDALALPFEVLYVNDGSADGTLTVLRALCPGDARVRVLDLSRNFGKEAALTAGLDHAEGQAVVLIDVDLQDPPELIPDMLRAWQQGAQVVLMQRLRRDGESWLKKATARGFYRVMARIAEVPLPQQVGDFQLLDRVVVQALRALPERTRFMKGLFAWVGFRRTVLGYHRDARQAGVSKWNYWRLWNFALEGITSFSSAPLKLASYMGLATAVLALGFGAYVFAKALIWGDPVQGYPSLMVAVLFLGGVQLMALGILGEYLARVFTEVKARPMYLLNRQPPPEASSGDVRDALPAIAPTFRDAAPAKAREAGASAEPELRR